MKKRKFLIKITSAFIIVFAGILIITRPTPRDTVDMFLELLFVFQPLIWFNAARGLLASSRYNKYLYTGSLAFFTGGIFEILEERLAHVIIDSLEDALILLGIILMTWSLSRIITLAYKRIEVLSAKNKKNYLASVTDSLTKIYNKNYLKGSFSTILRNNPTIFSKSICVFIDIDNFKIFNDTFGHDEGDRVLIELGHLINTHKRQGDFAFRYGGEEFLIFFMNTQAEFIHKKLDELRLEFLHFTKQHFPHKEATFTLSIGYTEYQFGESLEQLIKRADTAMYQSKNTGKNRITRIHPRGLTSVKSTNHL